VRNSDVRRKASLRTAADSTRAWEENAVRRRARDATRSAELERL